jgi:conjugal transfer pilus assembly protein TraA
METHWRIDMQKTPMSHLDRRMLGVLTLSGAVVLLLVLGTSMAGTTGTEFQTLYTLLTGWMTGFLGRVVAVIFIIIGVIAGAARQSIMGFVLGVSAGVGMFLAPAIIDNVVTATLPAL